MLSKPVENPVGKGEIAYYEQLLLFPHVFKRLVFQRPQKVSLCGNGLRYRLIKKTVGKGENAGN